MQKKTFLQLILIFSIFIILGIFFKIYFLNKTDTKNLKKEKKILILKDNKVDNLIHNLKYTSIDENNNEYFIKSKLGKLSEDQPEIIDMSGVKATIRYTNLISLIVTSDNAIYNKITQDTHFFNNVLIVYGEHNIKSNDLNLEFKNHLATISKNIIYNNLNTKLEADKIEIDLITKNIKISMNNSLKKIRILNTN